MKNLFESLAMSGKDMFLLEKKVLVTPFGGRIMGLAPDGEQNLFWVNESLNTPENAKTFFKGPGWLNIGGDRTWISPEIETHVSDIKRYPESIEVPKSIDPGAYIVKEAGYKSITLESAMKVLFHQCRKYVPLRLDKQISLIETAPVTLPGNVHFAGYSLDFRLRLTEQLTGNMRPGLWNIIQVPGGGEIIVATKKGAKPKTFIGEPVLTVKEDAVKCKIKTHKSFKFSIKASFSRGVLINFHHVGKSASLIVRKFFSGDDEMYADFPNTDHSDSGYSAQVYVDDGLLGGFGELEYHSPALNIDRGETDISDSSLTFGFSGPLKEIEEIREYFIGL